MNIRCSQCELKIVHFAPWFSSSAPCNDGQSKCNRAISTTFGVRSFRTQVGLRSPFIGTRQLELIVLLMPSPIGHPQVLIPRSLYSPTTPCPTRSTWTRWPAPSGYVQVDADWQLQGTSPKTFDSSLTSRGSFGEPSTFRKYRNRVDENTSMCVNS